MVQIAEWITDSAYVWGARVQDPASSKVAPGSDIEDDKVLPGGLEVARLTWRALGTAGEHAGLVAHIVASSSGGVFAKPYLSLARTTMLGAARALYVLEPDAPVDRRARALQLLRTEATDTHKVVGDWEASVATGDQGVRDARAVVDQFRTDCERELVAAGKKAGSVMTETALLAAVAPHLSEGVLDPEASLMHLWRLSSATAHARTWSWSAPLEDEDPMMQYAHIWDCPGTAPGLPRSRLTPDR